MSRCETNNHFSEKEINMKLETTTIIAGLALSLLNPIASGSALSFGPCFSQLIGDLETCNNDFDNEDGDSGSYNDPDAYAACRDAASLNHQSCINGHNQSLFWSAFQNFQTDLADCLNTFPTENDREAREDCIAAALAEYRVTVQNIIDDQNDQSGCSPVISDIALINPISALESAALSAGNTDGKYDTKVNTTLNFTAGVNANPGNQYDSSQIPCLKSAIAIAIYQTKFGFQVVPFDGDIDTTDGTTFNLHIIAEDLVHADEVDILNIFFSEEDLPVFGELSTIAIDDSPISGDWDRDEVLNTQDVTDFLNSYNAQTKRADLNDDGQVTPQDATEFAEEYTD